MAELASTLIDNGNPRAGEARARESLDLDRRLYPEESLEVAAAMQDLGFCLGSLGRNAEAEGLNDSP